MLRLLRLRDAATSIGKPLTNNHPAAGTGTAFTSEGAVTKNVPFTPFGENLAKSVIFKSPTVVLIIPDDGRPIAS